MSKIGTTETQMNEECHLVAALKAMGYANVEVSATPIRVMGWRGYSGRNANIVIRKHNLYQVGDVDRLTPPGHALADIGFVKAPGGNYELICDEDYPQDTQKWLDRLADEYAEQQTIAMAAERGYVFDRREVMTTPEGDRQVQLMFSVREF